MPKIGINWEANLLPNKNLKVPEPRYALVNRIVTYGAPKQLRNMR